MKVVGLTGGIGTGKSTVARFLADDGIPVIDADQVARDVVAPGTPALARIVGAFGPEVLDDQGALDRPAMRQRITHDPEACRTLEGITHPAIGAAVLEAIGRLQERGERFAVVEAALMVETGSYRQYQALIVVTCAPEVQLARVLARDGMAEADARALIASQLPLAEKEAVADHVIRNDGDLEGLRARTREVWSAIGG